MSTWGIGRGGGSRARMRFDSYSLRAKCSGDFYGMEKVFSVAFWTKNALVTRIASGSFLGLDLHHLIKKNEKK